MPYAVIVSEYSRLLKQAKGKIGSPRRKRFRISKQCHLARRALTSPTYIKLHQSPGVSSSHPIPFPLLAPQQRRFHQASPRRPVAMHLQTTFTTAFFLLVGSSSILAFAFAHPRPQHGNQCVPDGSSCFVPPSKPAPPFTRMCVKSSPR